MYEWLSAVFVRQMPHKGSQNRDMGGVQKTVKF